MIMFKWLHCYGQIYTASSYNGSKAMIDIGLKWCVSEYGMGWPYIQPTDQKKNTHACKFNAAFNRHLDEREMVL